MTEKTDPERVKKTLLPDVVDVQRQRTEDAWLATTTAMQNDVWIAGRDKDRRVSARKHVPERRRG